MSMVLYQKESNQNTKKNAVSCLNRILARNETEIDSIEVESNKERTWICG